MLAFCEDNSKVGTCPDPPSLCEGSGSETMELLDRVCVCVCGGGVARQISLDKCL